MTKRCLAVDPICYKPPIKVMTWPNKRLFTDAGKKAPLEMINGRVKENSYE